MNFHYHKDEEGLLVRCYHKTRLSWKAWLAAVVAATIAFPVEHYLWLHIPPFKFVSEHIGLVTSEHRHDDYVPVPNEAPSAPPSQGNNWNLPGDVFIE